MRNIFIGIAAILLGISSAQAQTEKEDLQDFPETMQTDMDSLYWDWQSKNFLFVDENCRMLPDGPKVFDISVSPRGDLKMPSDASSFIWVNEAEQL
mgnify:CR=1 FL=1